MCIGIVYVITYIRTLQDEASYHFNITNATAICKKYADIKIYQVMLYKFFDSQATANISNTTILSIVYMLQQAGESLQEIQVYALSRFTVEVS